MGDVMKSKLLALAFLAAMTGTASAAKVNWEGAIQVTAVAGTCVAEGIPVGDHYYAAYSPADLGDNEPDAFLGLFRHRGAASYQVVGSDPSPNKNYKGTDVGSRGGRGAWTGKFVTFNTTPATLTPATQTFAMNAKISNFGDTPGCTATIQGGFVLRRD